MPRQKILDKKLKRLEAKRDELKKRALASEDIAEVRSINAQLEDINAEIAETREELQAIEEETRSLLPESATLVNGNVEGMVVATTGEARTEDNDLEYRQAFMRFVQHGTPIPMELRGETTSTTDTQTAIPITVMNEVINTVRKRYGNLYNKVRKLNVQGGIEFPIGALQAKFKWVAEGTVSPRQKAGSLGKVSFNYHTAEIRVSQTFLSSILTLSSFEMKIAEVIAIAYLEAMDYAIVNGTGNGMPLGILNDARITNVVTMTASDINNWVAWRKKFFSKLPLGYRGGEFIFPVSTVDSYLETIADSNNNPIFNQATGLVVNDGDATNPNGRFYGRDISLVEPDIIADFDTASSGDVIGVYWQPDEYAFNENFGFTMRRYFDEETNEWVDKAIVITDGKILNPEGYVLIKKG